MMDLEHGIIDIDGFEISKDTTVEDIRGLSEVIATIKTDKRNRYTFVRFNKPIISNNVKMKVELTFNNNDKTDPFDIELWPELPDDIKDDGYGKLAKETLRLSKQWLKGIITSKPTTDIENCISYSFEDVYIGAMIIKDRDYGFRFLPISIDYKEK